LGTLFERGLDPDKRSQLGAHYTDREKIMMIVNPVIVEPLLAEWAEVKAKIVELLESAPKATKTKLLKGSELTASTKAKAAAEKLHQTFLEKLKAFRVLDPACGSGNFLYISLLELKNIEHRVNLEAEALGLTRGFPSIGPEAVLGIELNAYAAELARVSVWIGEIQWMRRNGFEAARNPILRTLSNIENRDAVLNADGTRAEWPKADVVVGNPPFLGNKKMIRELGEEYTFALRSAWKEILGGVDLVLYWFAKSWLQIQENQLTRVGLVATNSIRSATNRKLLNKIVQNGQIFNAWSDEEWTVDGASVRVSLICFKSEQNGIPTIDGKLAKTIFSDLKYEDLDSSDKLDISLSKDLAENLGVSFVGVILNGEFEVEGKLAREILASPINVNGRPNSEILRPSLNGDDFNGERPDKWVVDFGVERTEAESAYYERPFALILSKVKPFRFRRKDDGSYSVRAKSEREIWWRHARARPKMRKELSPFEQYIATPMVSSYRTFGMLHKSILPDQKLVVFARNDFTFLGILHSSIHLQWTIAKCGWIGSGNDITYSNTTVFLSFPFPEGLTPNIPAASYSANPRAIKIAAAAARLNELRENWLNPADLVKRVPEVVAGYPDRILPVNEATAAELKNRTLTKLYNARPAWLDNAHKALDEAVAESYGWGDDWRAGKLTEDEILARLFKLNQQRSNVTSHSQPLPTPRE
jgi:type II restriction/modification system DNA methylase subunit YeeA